MEPVNLRENNPRWKIYENLATINWNKLDGIEESLKELKREYDTACEMSRGPVLITVKEAREAGVIPSEYRSAHFYRFLSCLGDEGLTGDHLEKIPPRDYGRPAHVYFFSVSKQYHLYQDIGKNGIWSPPNAVLRKHDDCGVENQPTLHFHPGGNRMEAICRNNMEDTLLLVWDKTNFLGKESLSFPRWFQLFCAPESNPWFSKVTKFGNHPDEVFMIEGHVNQTIHVFDDSYRRLQKIFGNRKPRMYGLDYSEEMSEYVSFEGEHNVSLYAKSPDCTIKKEDLDILYDISEECPNPENDILRVEVKKIYK